MLLGAAKYLADTRDFEGTIHFRELKAAQQWPWKLIHDPAGERDRLFNLEEDPGELNDLARARPKKAAELLALLRFWREKVAAQMPPSTRS